MIGICKKCGKAEDKGYSEEDVKDPNFLCSDCWCPVKTNEEEQLSQGDRRKGNGK